MKDIKSYVIGFLSCACLFLIMGQTKSDSQIGRYQDNAGNIIDTTNGQRYIFKESGHHTLNTYKRWWKKDVGVVINP